MNDNICMDYFLNMKFHRKFAEQLKIYYMFSNVFWNRYGDKKMCTVLY